MPSEEILLAFDYGTVRIGVAIGNSLLKQARPLTVIKNQAPNHWLEINELVGVWKPTRFIVGLPVSTDSDREHVFAKTCQNFADELAFRHHLPVSMEDERYTSCVAEAMWEDHGRDIGLDAYAASVILEAWLNKTTE